MAERLLTFKTAAAMMRIEPGALYARVARGSIPGALIYERPRGPGMRPERFFRAEAFEAWLGGEVDSTADLMRVHDRREETA